MDDPIRSLQAVPLFAELTAAELRQLRNRLEERSFAANGIISREGEAWDGLYVVKSGRVKLSKGSMGRELTMAIMESGEPLNIAPLFEGGANVFTAQALGRASLYHLAPPDAQALVSKHPRVQKALLRILNRRLRHLAALASELAFTGVSARLASWMLAQSRAAGVRTPRGVGIKRELSLKELGSLMGTVGRVLSRSLAELRRSGAIDVTPDQIVIVDREKLRAIAREEAPRCSEDGGEAGNGRITGAGRSRGGR